MENLFIWERPVNFYRGLPSFDLFDVLSGSSETKNALLAEGENDARVRPYSIVRFFFVRL